MKRMIMAPFFCVALFALIQGCSSDGCLEPPRNCTRNLGGGGSNITVCLVYPDDPNRSCRSVTANAFGQITFQPPSDSYCQSRNLDLSACCDTVRVDLTQFPRNSATASPSSVNITAPPATLMIYGSGFTTYYGMPFVKVYDNNNRVIGYREAEEVASDGSWIRVPCPDMAQSYSGNYTLVISLGIGPNTYQEYAEASMAAYGRDAIDVDGDGFPNDVDCDDNDPNVNPLASPDCSGSYYDRNCNGIYDYDECYPGGGGGGCYVYSHIDRPVEPIYCY